ncbi:hypothetical protein N7490_008083 [Penicillium lividum]|nr:hypothetical protein N7490_008083 [Penicillium lividum]
MLALAANGALIYIIHSASDQWIAFTQKKGKITEDEAATIFNDLPPVHPDSDTGHPGVEAKKETRWAGKSFVSVDDVKPMMVFDESGNRVWREDIGGARVREIKYNGIVSSAMIYNKQPIIDHFRKVNDTMVAGVMDTPLMPGAGNYYFYLTRM